MSQKLKRRLQLAMLKVEMGWESYTFEQVKELWTSLDGSALQTQREFASRTFERQNFTTYQEEAQSTDWGAATLGIAKQDLLETLPGDSLLLEQPNIATWFKGRL
jgi:hypothetical protein